MTEERLLEGLFGESAPAESLVAEKAGRVVGFALYFTSFSTFRGRPGLYLEDLFVVPEERGRGVGGALIGAVAKRAVERGCERLDWSVLTWNLPAIGFYQRLRAEHLSDWTGYRLQGEGLRLLAEADPPAG